MENVMLRRPSESVREIETIDGAVLLDIHQGLCLGMSPISMEVWRLLKSDYTVDEIAEKLFCACPDVDRKIIHADVVNFVNELEKKGLLIKSEPSKHDRLVKSLSSFLVLRKHSAGQPSSARRSAIPNCLTLKALLGLLAFDLFGFGNNFSRIHAVATLWPRATTVPAEGAPEQICKAINYACLFYPKRVLCLQRSFVTTCLARSCGLGAEMVIGAQKAPFKAHAWTEVDHQAINERRDVQRLYLVWDRC